MDTDGVTPNNRKCTRCDESSRSDQSGPSEMVACEECAVKGIDCVPRFGRPTPQGRPGALIVESEKAEEAKRKKEEKVEKNQEKELKKELKKKRGKHEKYEENEHDDSPESKKKRILEFFRNGGSLEDLQRKDSKTNSIIRDLTTLGAFVNDDEFLDQSQKWTRQ